MTDTLNLPETSESDDDYFVRFLAYLWRYRIVCLLIVMAGSMIGVVSQRSGLPLRTTMSLRLVSPFMSYRNRDYWTLSAKVWRSELEAIAAKHTSPNLKIVVAAGTEPWLLTVSAEHGSDTQTEQLLKQLLNEAERQLGADRLPDDTNVPSAVPASSYSPETSRILSGLRQELSKTEELLQGSIPDVRPIEKTSVPQISDGSSIPFHVVAYYPWFQRLQDRACESLSWAASGRTENVLTQAQQQEVAKHLEEASSLMIQAWFAIDPSNPANMMPIASIQSLYNTLSDSKSVVRSAAIGAWFGAVAAVILLSVVMWFSEFAPRISELSKGSPAPRNSVENG